MKRIREREIKTAQLSQKHGILRKIYRYRMFYILILPAALWVLFFKYIPMYGLSMAFVNYNFSKGVLGSQWNDFLYFKQLFSSSMFLDALRNTIIISFYKLIFGFTAPILLAVLINEIAKPWYKRTIQTALYLPHFVSWVVYAGLVTILLSPETGFVNALINAAGGNDIYFLAEPKLFRGILVITEILKEAGWGTVVYIAAISGIDQSLYEAAAIDGAGKLKQILHVTIPSISGMIVVMLILKTGHILSAGMEQVINLYNPTVLKVGDILDTYVYRIGIVEFQMGLSTAAGLFQSVVGLMLVLFTNKISKMINGSGLI